MSRWLGRQARALAVTALKLGRAPISTLFNVAVLGIALALPAALYLGLVNVQAVTRTVSPEPQLTVFLALDATAIQVKEIGGRLAAHPRVERILHVPRDQALAELTRATGIAGLAEGLGGNPLPDAFVVNAREDDPAGLERLRSELSAWSGVALVQVDVEWAQRLDAALRVGRVGFMLLATVLAFALVAVTFNTIRLQILTQREEIEVASLIGATRGFVRRPFLYYGALLGLLGGIAACVFLWLAMSALNAALLDLSYVYGARWQLAYFGALDVGSLLVFAAFLGWLGAWLSVTRHLAEARPG